MLVVLASAAAVSTPAAGQPQGAGLAGRWKLVFEIPDGRFDTPVEFSVAPDGAVTAAVLGASLVRFDRGRLSGSELTLGGVSSYGPVQVTATVRGDSLAGEWRISPALGGRVTGAREAAEGPALAPVAVFDSVWSTLDRAFFDPAFGGADWAEVRRRYRPRAEQARGDGELVTVVREMLRELKTSHLDFSARGGALAMASSQGPAVAWRTVAPGIGYLRVAEFRDGPEIIAAIDSAFAALQGTEGLVLDLRGNPGGTLGAAMRIGDHLFTAPRPAGLFATRAGLARRGVRSIDALRGTPVPWFAGYGLDEFRAAMRAEGVVMLQTGGRAPAYTGRVVVLVDEGSASTTEGLASVIKELGAGTLVGRTTAGAMLSSTQVTFPGGWVLRFPEADFRTPGGSRVEGAGVAPDIRVERTETGDAELAAALRLLGIVR
ncbi:MAG TPA: S41 family peptidase [Longimicrobium sp.]|nr:S41 family peptidase [Longimicrobium sp.]